MGSLVAQALTWPCRSVARTRYSYVLPARTTTRAALVKGVASGIDAQAPPAIRPWRVNRLTCARSDDAQWIVRAIEDGVNLTPETRFAAGVIAERTTMSDGPAAES